MSLSRIDARADPMMMMMFAQDLVSCEFRSQCSKDTSFFSASRSGSLYSAAILFVQQKPAESPPFVFPLRGRGATWRRRTMTARAVVCSEMSAGGAPSRAKSFGLQEELQRSARDRWQVAFGV